MCIFAISFTYQNKLAANVTFRVNRVNQSDNSLHFLSPKVTIKHCNKNCHFSRVKKKQKLTDCVIPFRYISFLTLSRELTNGVTLNSARS